MSKQGFFSQSFACCSFKLNSRYMKCGHFKTNWLYYTRSCLLLKTRKTHKLGNFVSLCQLGILRFHFAQQQSFFATSCHAHIKDKRFLNIVNQKHVYTNWHKRAKSQVNVLQVHPNATHFSPLNCCPSKPCFSISVFPLSSSTVLIHCCDN